MHSSLAVAQAKYWHLRQMTLFSELEGPAVRELGAHFDTELVEAGDTVYEFGDAADRVYVLQSGRIKVTRASSDGKEFILYLVGPGEIFGELSILGRDHRVSTATVLDDAFICAVDRGHFESFMRNHPGLALQVARVIGERKERTEKRVLDLISKDVRTRLAHTLAALADEFGVVDDAGVRLELPLTQTDLAQLVGSTRETTSTVFNEFRRAELVASEGKTIWALDTEALAGYPGQARPSGRAA